MIYYEGIPVYIVAAAVHLKGQAGPKQITAERETMMGKCGDYFRGPQKVVVVWTAKEEPRRSCWGFHGINSINNRSILKIGDNWLTLGRPNGQ